MCEETAKANAESFEKGKARGNMCDGKETVCDEVAKGEWNAPQKRPCARNDRAMAATRDPVREDCEKAKAGNRVCMESCRKAVECARAAKANARKDCEKKKAAARSVNTAGCGKSERCQKRP